AEPPRQLERRRERPRHRHLLVEREPYEQRERLAHEQPIGLLVAGEAEPVVSHAYFAFRGKVLVSTTSKSEPFTVDSVRNCAFDQRGSGAPEMNQSEPLSASIIP